MKQSREAMPLPAMEEPTVSKPLTAAALLDTLALADLAKMF